MDASGRFSQELGLSEFDIRQGRPVLVSCTTSLDCLEFRLGAASQQSFNPLAEI